MKAHWKTLIQNDPDLALDLLEERAAIIAESIPCSQYLGEETAAKQWGAQSYADIRRAIARSKKAKSA